MSKLVCSQCLCYLLIVFLNKKKISGALHFVKCYKYIQLMNFEANKFFTNKEQIIQNNNTATHTDNVCGTLEMVYLHLNKFEKVFSVKREMYRRQAILMMSSNGDNVRSAAESASDDKSLATGTIKECKNPTFTEPQ